jgi:hypothetical protein
VSLDSSQRKGLESDRGDVRILSKAAVSRLLGDKRIQQHGGFGRVPTMP